MATCNIATCKIVSIRKVSFTSISIFNVIFLVPVDDKLPSSKPKTKANNKFVVSHNRHVTVLNCAKENYIKYIF